MWEEIDSATKEKSYRQLDAWRQKISGPKWNFDDFCEHLNTCRKQEWKADAVQRKPLVYCCSEEGSNVLLHDRHRDVYYVLNGRMAGSPCRVFVVDFNYTVLARASDEHLGALSALTATRRTKSFEASWKAVCERASLVGMDLEKTESKFVDKKDLVKMIDKLVPVLAKASFGRKIVRVIGQPGAGKSFLLKNLNPQILGIDLDDIMDETFASLRTDPMFVKKLKTVYQLNDIPEFVSLATNMLQRILDASQAKVVLCVGYSFGIFDYFSSEYFALNTDPLTAFKRLIERESKAIATAKIDMGIYDSENIHMYTWDCVFRHKIRVGINFSFESYQFWVFDIIGSYPEAVSASQDDVLLHVENLRKIAYFT